MRSGFTLIELVIGLLISSILLTALYSSFFITGKVVKRSDDITSIDMHLAVIAHQFENDITGIIAPLQLSTTTTTTVAQSNQASATEQPAEQKKESQEIKDIFVSKNKNDSVSFVSFITNNPLQMHRKEGPTSRLVRVVYRLTPTQDKKAYVLTRQESTNLDLTAFEIKGQQGIRAYELGQNIKSLSVEYKYPENTPQQKDQEQQAIVFKSTKEWSSESSNAKEKEKQPKIPQFITINLELWDLAYRQSLTFVLNYTVASFSNLQEKKTEAKPAPPAHKTSAAIPKPKP